MGNTPVTPPPTFLTEGDLWTLVGILFLAAVIVTALHFIIRAREPLGEEREP